VVAFSPYFPQNEWFLTSLFVVFLQLLYLCFCSLLPKLVISSRLWYSHPAPSLLCSCLEHPHSRIWDELASP
jgi:hypothetical protein